MDNAASRLLAILESGKKLQGNISCVSAWKTLLNANSKAEVPEKFGEVLWLAGKAADEVLRISPNSTYAVSHWRNCILAAVSNSHLASPWENFISHIDGHTLEYLRTHAELIDGKFPAKTLNSEKLQEAKKKLLDALGEIRNSDLDPATRIMLTAKIQAIITAIDNYFITGQEGVFDSLRIAAFDLVAVEQKQRDFPGHSKAREGLSILADLMSYADGLIALSAPVTKLLGIS